MALPNTNISVAMVRGALEASSNDVGRLCIHPNINKWSKHKPINHSSVVPLTEAQFALLQYGINIFELPSTVGATFDVQNWDYNHPTTLSPKRLGDFRLYEHNAPVPLLQNQGTEEIVFAKFVNVNAGIMFDIPRTPVGLEGYRLNIENLATSGGLPIAGNYYLAADLYPRGATSGSPIDTIYSINKIGYSTGEYNNDDRSIRLDEPSIPSGDYAYHLYLSTHNEMIPIGELRKNYPINWTSAYPNKINMVMRSLADQFTIEFVGIMPSLGSWPDGTTSPKTRELYNSGNYSSTDFGTLNTFIARFRITNTTGHTVYIPRSELRVKYSFLDRWTDTELTETYGSVESGNNIVINNGESALFDSVPLRLLPANIPSESVNITVSPNFKLYHFNDNTPIGGDPYEPFTHDQFDLFVSLNYTND